MILMIRMEVDTGGVSEDKIEEAVVAALSHSTASEAIQDALYSCCRSASMVGWELADKGGHDDEVR
jgi:hypothetical protein